MGIHINALIANRATVDIQFGEDPESVLHVDYSPDKISPASLADLDGLEKLPERVQLARMVALLSDLLLAWDLLENDSEIAVPITEQRLRHLGAGFLMTVLNAVMDDMRVGEASGTTPKLISNAPSRKRAR